MLGECDIIVASEHATFFDPHVTYGMTSSFESMHMVYKMPFGEVVRMQLLGNDERMSAKRAYEIGLVSEVVPLEQLPEAAGWVAERIAEKPPLAVQGTLRALWAARDLPRSQALELGYTFVKMGTTRSLARVRKHSARASAQMPDALAFDRGRRDAPQVASCATAASASRPPRDRARRPGAQVRLDQRLVVLELAGLTDEPNLSLVQDHHDVGQPERVTDVLLDEEDGRPRVADRSRRCRTAARPAAARGRARARRSSASAAW